jgi:hypothetical protein
MWQILVAAPLIVVCGVVLVPLFLLWGAALWIRGLTLRTRAVATWPSGKVALIVYSRGAESAHYIEELLLPSINDACIVVDRSNPQWKRQFPLERRLIEHFAGGSQATPAAIVFPPGARAKVFRMYEALREAQKGRTRELDATLALVRAAIVGARA